MAFYSIGKENMFSSAVVTSDMQGCKSENPIKDVICGETHLRNHDSPDLSHLGIRG